MTPITLIPVEPLSTTTSLAFVTRSTDPEGIVKMILDGARGGPM